MPFSMYALQNRLAGRQPRCTLAIRPCPPPHTPGLPALGGAAFQPMLTTGLCCAEPQLLHHEGEDWVFCRCWSAPGPASIAAVRIADHRFAGAPEPVLPADAAGGWAWPAVFAWRGALWLLPSGADGALHLFRCAAFPNRWEPAARFTAGGPLSGAVVLGVTTDAVTLLASEAQPGKPAALRWRRCRLRAGGETDEAPTGFTLDPDETFNLQNRAFGPDRRSGGPAFALAGQPVRPVRAGGPPAAGQDVALQFFAGRPGPDGTLAPGPNPYEIPLCRVSAANLPVNGLPAPRLLGPAAYARNDLDEVVGVWYWQ